MGMNNVLASLAASLFLPASLMAQSPGNGAPQTVDGIMKQGSRVVLMRGGTSTQLDKSLTLANGMRIDADGTITRPDRTQTTLQPTQMVTLAGMIVPLPAGMPTGTATSGDHSQATNTNNSAAPIKAGEGTGSR